MKSIVYLYLLNFFFCCASSFAQTDTLPYAKNTVKAVRTKEYSNLVSHSINENLSGPLTSATEENWMDAFMAIELTNYRSPAVDNKIKQAFDSIEKEVPAFSGHYWKWLTQITGENLWTLQKD